ncbi:MAG TPA: succinate dehydrogenase cytochrome b subunit [Trebonia sp.]|nr:succinate dehydrogenase cytochrome b subunit [Trebonia sp.]
MTSAHPRTGSRTLRLYRTTIGKKAVMAVTGIVFLLFLVAHMIGNLKVFYGRADYDGYAAWLRTMGSPAIPHRWALTILEVILVACVLAHIGSAAELALRARRARPVRYQGGRPKQGYASRTMRTGAILVVIFVLYHLLDLTFRVLNPKGIAGDPYGNVVADFSNGWVTAFYVICLLVLGLHIRHGVWSAAQTLGRSNARRERGLNAFAIAFSAVLTGGFLAVPFGVLIGVVS